VRVLCVAGATFLAIRKTDMARSRKNDSKTKIGGGVIAGRAPGRLNQLTRAGLPVKQRLKLKWLRPAASTGVESRTSVSWALSLSRGRVEGFENEARITPLVSLLLDPNQSADLVLERAKELESRPSVLAQKLI